MASSCGGGVVSADPRSGCSEYPLAAGDAESRSLMKSRAESGGVVVVGAAAGAAPFMATRTEAASKSWTCWCLEIKSLEV